MDKATCVYIGFFGSGISIGKEEETVLRIGFAAPNFFINCYHLDDGRGYHYRQIIFGESEVYHSMEEALPAASKLVYDLRKKHLQKTMDDDWLPEIICVEFFSPHLNIEDNLNG